MTTICCSNTVIVVVVAVIIVVIIIVVAIPLPPRIEMQVNSFISQDPSVRRACLDYEDDNLKIADEGYRKFSHKKSTFLLLVIADGGMNEFYEAAVTSPSTTNGNPEHFDYSVDLEIPQLMEDYFSTQFVRGGLVSGKFRGCVHRGRSNAFAKGCSISAETRVIDDVNVNVNSNVNDNIPGTGRDHANGKENDDHGGSSSENIQPVHPLMVTNCYDVTPRMELLLQQRNDDLMRIKRMEEECEMLRARVMDLETKNLTNSAPATVSKEGTKANVKANAKVTETAPPAATQAATPMATAAKVASDSGGGEEFAEPRKQSQLSSSSPQLPPRQSQQQQQPQQHEDEVEVEVEDQDEEEEVYSSEKITIPSNFPTTGSGCQDDPLQVRVLLAQ